MVASTIHTGLPISSFGPAHTPSELAPANAELSVGHPTSGGGICRSVAVVTCDAVDPRSGQ